MGYNLAMAEIHEDSRGGSLAIAALAIGSGCLAVTLAARSPGGPAGVWLFLAAMGVMAGGYLAALRILLRGTAEAGMGTGRILGLTALFSLILLAGPPLLDDDLHRYLWEGKVVLHGRNPYLHAPASPALADLRDDGSRLVGYPELPSPYPPMAQAIFALTRLVSGGALVPARAFLLLFFAGSVWLTMDLVRRSGGDPRLAVIYAWNPVVLKEFANSGHIEPAAILLMLLAFRLQARGREGWAGAAIGAAVLTKVFPVFAAPLLLFRSRRKGRLLTGAALAGVVLYSPFLPAGRGVLGSLGTYARWWVFNHGVWEAWEWLAGPAAARVLFWAAVAFASLAVGWSARRAAEGEAARRGGVLLFWTAACSPAVMPWYLTWGLPLMAPRAWLPAAVFSTLSATSYAYYLAHRDLPWLRRGIHLLLPLLVVWAWWRGRSVPGERPEGAQDVGEVVGPEPPVGPAG